MSIVNPAGLARKYFDGDLTNDDREVLLFAWSNALRAICDLTQNYPVTQDRFAAAYGFASDALGRICSHGNHIGYCAFCDAKASLKLADPHYIEPSDREDS